VAEELRTVRSTVSICPDCMREVPGAVMAGKDGAWLVRTCPDHGEYRFPLSRHGEAYADLDRFFFDVIEGRRAAGRITNYWVFLTNRCQQKCPYCSVNTDSPFHDDMKEEDFRQALREYRGTKLTLSGGEPTMHPQCLDFFREARKMGVATQLATNGLRLADLEFCRQLKEAGVTEVRISMEYWDEGLPDTTGMAHHREQKRKAVENCLRAGIPVILSPTLLKGCNERTLLETLAYAADRPEIKELSVNGFSWNGSGTGLARDLMIMPDEMVDVIHGEYGGDRESYFTLAKTMFAALHLLNIRLCLNTQVLVFVRRREGMRPVNEFLNMRGMKRGVAAWERFARAPRAVSLAAFCVCMLPALSLRTVPLLWSLALLVFSNLSRIKIHRYPARLLPVVLNTNCSPLNADNDIVPRCMSGNLFMSGGKLTEGMSALTLRNRVHRADGDAPAKHRGE